MLTGKIITTNKNLESHDIPIDRFYKRMEVYIFKTINKRKIPMKFAVKLCTCHDMFYVIGDCEDDEMPYWIPVEWVKLDE